jgi:Mg-chelatase subunit ChlD
MSTEFSSDPREALEASLTALLLGELSEDQANFVRRALAQDAELARRYERLKQTIEMVRQIEAGPATSPIEKNQVLKLSDHRRQALLQKFKTVAPAEFVPSKKRKLNWVIPAGIAAVFMAFVGTALLPALSRSKSRGQRYFASDDYRRGAIERPLNETDQQVQRQSAATTESRELTRKPAIVQEAQLAQDRAKIFLPAESVPQDTAGPEVAGKQIIIGGVGKLPELQAGRQTEPQNQFGGGGGGGGGIGGALAHAPQQPSLLMSDSEARALARQSFLQRYGLQAHTIPEGKKETTTAWGDSDNDSLVDLFKKSEGHAVAFSIDPSTGLPVQAAAEEMQRAVDPVTGLPINSAGQASSVSNPSTAFSATLKGYTESSPAPVPAQSLAENEKSKRTSLGDEPVVGKLFQPAGKPLDDEKLAEIARADRRAAAQPGGVVLPSSEPQSSVVAQNKTDQALTDAGSISLGYNVNQELDGSNRKFTSNGPQTDWFDSSGRTFYPNNGNGSFGKDQTFTYSLGANETPSNGQNSPADKAKSRDLSLPTESLQRADHLMSLAINAGETGGGEANARAQIRGEEKKLAAVKEELVQRQSQTKGQPESDAILPKPASPAPIPQPEFQTKENAFSTFSLNVSDVSFKLAAASLEKGVMPEAGSIRAEEFINAFDYHEPEPAPGSPFAFTWERARYPFAQNRDVLRFSLKTASQGRQAGRPLNLVLLLDNSGSMERADRVQIINEALRVLATQLQPQDTLSVVSFARTARLWVDGVSGDKAGQVAKEVSGLTPQGGTNLEEAMNLGYQTALRHYRADGINRVVLLTDGAANLGDVDSGTLQKKVETNRKQGIAFDCFGVGWEGYNDDLLEVLSRHGDGRYGFLNTPEEASSEFASQLAGALRVAAADVKVQVEFNPDRVTAYRQIGYAKHQLTQEQFRDNTVDAAELGAAESGNALYVVAVNPAGVGPLATVRVRFKVPGTSEYKEHAWAVPFEGGSRTLQQASPAMRLCCAAGAFAEWLSASPYAAEVNPNDLLRGLSGVPEIYGADARPKKLEWMLHQAKSLTGK